MNLHFQYSVVSMNARPTGWYSRHKEPWFLIKGTGLKLKFGRDQLFSLDKI